MSNKKKEEATQLDLLLGVDESKFTRPTAKVEMNGLTERLGAEETIKWTIQAVDEERYEEIQENAVTIPKDGKGEPEINYDELKRFVILDGVIDPDLRSKALMDKFGVPTPKGVLKKMLLVGEIDRLYQEISDLSGFGEDSVKTVKN